MVPLQVLVAGLIARKVALEQALTDPRVDVLDQRTFAEFRGDGRASVVLLRNDRSGEKWEARPGGAFVLVGRQPNTGFLRGMVNLDERGLIRTDATLQTSKPGCFRGRRRPAGEHQATGKLGGRGRDGGVMTGSDRTHRGGALP